MASIIIIGAGAIGTFLGARLHRAGHDVTLVARGERLRALQANGLTLDIDGAFEQMTLPATETLRDHQPADLVVLATKTAGLDEALRLAEPVVGPTTAILTVQNGVEAADEVAARFPQATVFASRVHGFFELDGDTVRHVGVEPSVEFGSIDANPAERGEDLRAMLTAAMREVETLAHAHGIALSPDIVAQTLAFVATFPDDATSSMQRDVLAGRPSEYGDLTGAIPRLASAVGKAAPCFTRIDTLIRERGLLLP